MGHNHINNKRPRVFVTNENPKYNYNMAEQHGDLVFVTEKDFSYTANSLHNQQVIDRIAETLADFDPERDSIILSGSPAVQAAAMMVVGQLYGRAGILRYSSQSGAYDRMFIDIGEGRGNRI